MKKRTRIFGLVLLTALVSILSPLSEVSASTPVLQQGDRGGYVWDLQHRLQQLGLYQLSQDGIFGPHSQQAVVQFQQRYGLVADGIVGAQTWNALRNVTFTQNEIEMMAKLVHAEAKGESFEGKVAVAAVVLNRLSSDQFPNTIEEVIFEPGAFTPVADGQYYTTPDAEDYRAVYYAIRGWDPAGGALFYFNPQTATSAWIWSRQQIRQIGNHIFAS